MIRSMITATAQASQKMFTYMNGPPSWKKFFRLSKLPPFPDGAAASSASTRWLTPVLVKAQILSAASGLRRQPFDVILSCHERSGFSLAHGLPVVAFGVRTANVCPVPLRVFLQQVRRAALRAGLGQRAIPRAEFAVGIAVASKEDPSAPGAALSEVSLLALGARDADRDRLGRLAFGIPRACQEAAESPPFDHHWAAALFAALVG